MDSQLSLFGQALQKNKLSTEHWFDMPFLCIDTETTGLNVKNNRVIEVAYILFEKQREIFSQSFLCKIEEAVPEIITQITGITDSMLAKEKKFSEISNNILEAMQKAHFIVAYNAPFDKGFIEAEFNRTQKLMPEKKWVDPLVFIKEIDKYEKGKKLGDACSRWGIKLAGAHRALADTRATGQLLLKLSQKLSARKLDKLEDLFKQQELWRKEQQAAYKRYRQRKRN